MGVIQYAASTSNSQDWDLGYDWQSLRAKLTGDAVRFDTNHFDTNMMTHPFAGTFYYIAARGNHLSVFESFLFAASASTLWEYIGEFREMVSVNDLIVTPLSGIAFGEALTQLGVFIKRSSSTPVYQVLGAILAPSTTINDAIDGTPTPRDGQLDALGLSRVIGHRFSLRVGMGIVNGGPAQSADGRFGLYTEIVNAEHYNAPGKKSELLTDGAVSRLDLEGAVDSRGLRDAQADVMVAPFAYYAHSLVRREGVLDGQRFVIGPTVGFDYGLHAYPSRVTSDVDRIAGVHVGGLTVEYRKLGAFVHVRTALDVRPEFAAVNAFALEAYSAHRGALDALPTVTRNESYYFAAGGVLAPSVELGIEQWTLGAQARFESYWGIEGLDRHQEQIRNETTIHDRRTLGRVYVSYAPIVPVDLRLEVERRGRSGEIGNTNATTSEWAFITSAGVRF